MEIFLFISIQLEWQVKGATSAAGLSFMPFHRLTGELTGDEAEVLSLRSARSQTGVFIRAIHEQAFKDPGILTSH
jgi:hypothetical protein